MSPEITIEFLETTHSFPGTYIFKAIGRNDASFVERVVAAVRAELELERDPDFSTRAASGGRHICVTVEPLVSRAASVLDVYARLKRVDGMVMMF